MLISRGEGLFNNIQKRWFIEGGDPVSYVRLFQGHKSCMVRKGGIRPRTLAKIGDYVRIKNSRNYKKLTEPVALHTLPTANQLDFDSESAMTVN